MHKLGSLFVFALLAFGGVASAQCDYEAGSMWLRKHRWATVRRAGVTLFGIGNGTGGT